MEFAERSKLVRVIERFQMSWYYPIAIAVLCTVSGLSNKYIYVPILTLIVLSVIFSAIFVKDSKVFLPPMLMIYYGLGTDFDGAYGASQGDITASFDKSAFICLIILAIATASALIMRFIFDGTFKYTIRKRGGIFWGIIAIDIALITNGLFSDHWTPSCLLFGVTIALLFSLFALVLRSVILQSDKNIISYVCTVMVAASYIVLAQVAYEAFSALLKGNLFIYYGQYEHWVINRSSFQFSWGVATIIGGASVLGIPAALYLARDHKRPILYYISSILFLLVSFLVNTRSAMLAGTLSFILGIIIICFSGRNKKINLIFTLSCCGVISVCIVFLCAYFYASDSLSTYIREAVLMLSRPEDIYARFELIAIGINDFISSLVFGVGLLKGNSTGVEYLNAFGNMYHNVIIQFTASMGVVGILSFLFHIKDIFILGFTKPTSRRIILLLLPCMILAMSFFDNFFFYLNFQIAYISFLVLAEKELDITKTV